MIWQKYIFIFNKMQSLIILQIYNCCMSAFKTSRNKEFTINPSFKDVSTRRPASKRENGIFPSKKSNSISSNQIKLPKQAEDNSNPSRHHRQHSPGSVYHHASRLSPCNASSNFSSSFSGSVEIIMSELDNPKEEDGTENVEKKNEDHKLNFDEISELEQDTSKKITKQQGKKDVLKHPWNEDLPARKEIQKAENSSFVILNQGMTQILNSFEMKKQEVEATKRLVKQQLLGLFTKDETNNKNEVREHKSKAKNLSADLIENNSKIKQDISPHLYHSRGKK
ncbi:unnamed protein product [Blepharisma stoltei]|uniref:Uncharacterized protein n=1 Tax=Blepharisma stoltei TaxID=1481888 RepID=A0AAU9J843_9CILI|nr:unnamed protein product [Blepharisma stoltei]